MKRITSFVLFYIAFTGTGYTQQWMGSAQAGINVPMSDFAETYNIGFGFTATGLYKAIDQVWLTGSAGYHQFSREKKFQIVEGKLSTIPILAGIRYVFASSEITPYIGGELGIHFINWTYDKSEVTQIETIEESETDFGFSLGGGVYFKLGESLTMDVNLKYTLSAASDLDITYLQANAGLIFPL